MASTTVMALEFDGDGFLRDPACWTSEAAEQMARSCGLPALEAAHWEMIRQLREHYLKCGAIVPPAHICRLIERAPQCMSELFPSMLEAWRIAGLPNPGEEAKSYM